jgi:hypothetical protein
MHPTGDGAGGGIGIPNKIKKLRERQTPRNFALSSKSNNTSTGNDTQEAGGRKYLSV